MTPEEFTELAKAQTDTVEGGHMGKIDFRVGGKIFATLDRSAGVGTLKLSPEDQMTMLSLAGKSAYAANGAWGARGWTRFALVEVTADFLAPWMQAAWAGVAPKKLLR